MVNQKITELVRYIGLFSYSHVYDIHEEHVIQWTKSAPFHPFGKLFLIDDGQVKTMWHLYRIEEQILRYVSTGLWTLELTATTIEKIRVYKEHYRSQNAQTLSEFKHIIEYLKEVKNHE